MKKSTVTLFGISVLALSWYGINNPSYYFDILLSDTTPFLYARILLVLCLAAFVFFYKLRTYTVKFLVGLSGVALFFTAFLTIFSPSLFGYFNNYVPIGDSLIFIEGGIIAAVASSELPGHHSKLFFWLSRQVRQLRPTFRSGLAPQSQFHSKVVRRRSIGAV